MARNSHGKQKNIRSQDTGFGESREFDADGGTGSGAVSRAGPTGTAAAPTGRQHGTHGRRRLDQPGYGILKGLV